MNLAENPAMKLKFAPKVTQPTKRNRVNVLALPKPEYQGQDFF
jgi:hypothetical protein